jgi:hypothetical protein
MQDRPTAEELVRAVQEHLEREVLPNLDNPKLRFQTLVAANVLAIVERELAHGERAARAELAGLRALQGAGGAPEPAGLAEVHEEIRRRTRSLCEAIRKGEPPSPEVRDHVRKVTLAKLAIANPAYRSLSKSSPSS